MIQDPQYKPKRGDVHPVTGLIYWDTFKGKQRWRDAETIARWRANMMRHVKNWQVADPKRHREAMRRFRSVHGKRRNAEMRDYRNDWKKRKRRTDPIYALKTLLSARVRGALKRMSLQKEMRAIEVLGCTVEQLRAHLEAQFKPGMTWANRGYRGWHIDHKTPLATAKTKEDVYRLCHYTNLQPLWWHENFSKGSKLIAA